MQLNQYLYLLNPHFLTNTTYFLILLAYTFNMKKLFVQLLPMTWANAILGTYICVFYINEILQRQMEITKKNIQITNKQKELIRWFTFLFHLIPTLIFTRIAFSYINGTAFPRFESLITTIFVIAIYSYFVKRRIYGNVPYNLLIALYIPLILLSIYWIIELKV